MHHSQICNAVNSTFSLHNVDVLLSNKIYIVKLCYKNGKKIFLEHRISRNVDLVIYDIVGGGGGWKRGGGHISNYLTTVNLSNGIIPLVLRGITRYHCPTHLSCKSSFMGISAQTTSNRKNRMFTFLYLKCVLKCIFCVILAKCRDVVKQWCVIWLYIFIIVFFYTKSKNKMCL